MALNFNSVEPTQIIAKDSGSAQTIAFPTGTKIVTEFQQTIDGKKQAVATFTSTHNITANMVYCNDKTLNSSSQLISEQTQASTTYLFYAKFSNNTLSLEQRVVYSFTGASPQSVPLQGRDYSATFYSATDLTVLKYGTTAVWGKPFSLTVQQSFGSEYSIHRNISPNQHASTGNITSGATVYYGDTLTITATPASGYKLVSFTINGTEYASGQTSAVSQTITVTSAVSIVVNTESAVSWKTVWTGNAIVARFNWKGSTSGTKTVELANGTPENVDWSRPTKITGTASANVGSPLAGGTSKKEEINALELIDGKGNYLVEASKLYVGSVGMSIKRNSATQTATVSSTCQRISGSDFYSSFLELTKVEQYY